MQQSMYSTWRSWLHEFFFDAFCVIFRAPPVVLDDEEFFVVEGSPGCRSRRESDSR